MIAMHNSTLVSLKGTKEGLLITLGEGAWPDLLRELASQLNRPGADRFFRGARVRLDMGQNQLGEPEMEQLARLLADHDMKLQPLFETPVLPGIERPVAPVSPSEPEPEVRAAERIKPNLPDFLVADAEMLPESPAPVLEPQPRPLESASEALMIRRTIRSGQVIHHSGHVVIFGDVNPGSQIIAGGDVLVWGKLRGLVHAGASGDDHAIVGALQLAPPQLRIGNHIAQAPEERKKKTRGAEVASVRDGQIVVESWKPS